MCCHLRPPQWARCCRPRTWCQDGDGTWCHLHRMSLVRFWMRGVLHHIQHSLTRSLFRSSQRCAAADPRVPFYSQSQSSVTAMKRPAAGMKARTRLDLHPIAYCRVLSRLRHRPVMVRRLLYHCSATSSSLRHLPARMFCLLHLPVIASSLRRLPLHWQATTTSLHRR